MVRTIENPSLDHYTIIVITIIMINNMIHPWSFMDMPYFSYDSSQQMLVLISKVAPKDDPLPQQPPWRHLDGSTSPPRPFTPVP